LFVYRVSTNCALDIELSSNPASCPEANDGSIFLASNESDYYELSVINLDNGSTANPQSLAPGSYEVTVSRFGCSTTSTVELLPIERAPIDFEFDESISTLTVTTAGESYEWSLNGVVLPGLNTQTIQISEEGNYAVVITEASGCVLPSDPFFVSLSDVDVIDSITAWELRPNPVQDIITMTLDVNEAQSLSLSLLDATGSEVMSRTIEVGGQSTHVIDISNYAVGVYIIMLSDGTSTQSQKIVKQ